MYRNSFLQQLSRKEFQKNPSKLSETHSRQGPTHSFSIKGVFAWSFTKIFLIYLSEHTGKAVVVVILEIYLWTKYLLCNGYYNCRLLMIFLLCCYWLYAPMTIFKPRTFLATCVNEINRKELDAVVQNCFVFQKHFSKLIENHLPLSFFSKAVDLNIQFH